MPHAAESSELFTGLYAEHLARLEPYVDDDRCSSSSTSGVCSSRRPSSRARSAFLGVEPIAIPDVPAARLSTAARPTARAPFELSPERRAVVVETYRPDVERLVARHPEIDLALWKNFG